MKRIYLFLVGLCLAFVNANAVEINGLEYTLNNADKTASVTGNVNMWRGVVPGTILYNDIEYTVTSIAADAFRVKNIASIVLPESIKTIGSYAFYGCDYLESIVIPEGVTSIGYSAFRYCKSLRSITLPKSLTSIGGYAFSSTSLENISLPENIVSIGAGLCKNTAFYNNENNWEDNLLYIGDYLVAAKDVEQIVIKEETKLIANEVFTSHYKLESISFPAHLTSIGGKYAFQNCINLKNITLPEGITYIDKQAFEDCI